MDLHNFLHNGLKHPENLMIVPCTPASHWLEEKEDGPRHESGDCGLPLDPASVILMK